MARMLMSEADREAQLEEYLANRRIERGECPEAINREFHGVLAYGPDCLAEDCLTAEEELERHLGRLLWRCRSRERHIQSLSAQGGDWLTAAKLARERANLDKDRALVEGVRQQLSEMGVDDAAV